MQCLRRHAPVGLVSGAHERSAGGRSLRHWSCYDVYVPHTEHLFTLAASLCQFKHRYRNVNSARAALSRMHTILRACQDCCNPTVVQLRLACMCNRRQYNARRPARQLPKPHLSHLFIEFPAGVRVMSADIIST